jgi:hypothetical protein
MTLEFIEHLAAIGAGLFGFLKWIDTRNREIKEKRYKTYMDLIGVISGKRHDSTTPNITEQIGAVWFLVEYREYYEITKKIFSDCDLEKSGGGSGPWVEHVVPQIHKLIEQIGGPRRTG